MIRQFALLKRADENWILAKGPADARELEMTGHWCLLNTEFGSPLFRFSVLDNELALADCASFIAFMEKTFSKDNMNSIFRWMAFIFYKAYDGRMSQRELDDEFLRRLIALSGER
jgi:hypothetical protein